MHARKGFSKQNSGCEYVQWRIVLDSKHHFVPWQSFELRLDSFMNCFAERLQSLDNLDVVDSFN
jgi:hypothetical protein